MVGLLGEFTRFGPKTDFGAEQDSDMVATNRVQRNQAMAAQRVRDYLEPFIGYKLLCRVTKDDLRAYRLWLEKQDKKPLTVVHILADARCLFRWCEDMGWLDRSPIPNRLLPRVQERPPDRLSDAEVEAVLSVPEPYAFICRFGHGAPLGRADSGE